MLESFKIFLLIVGLGIFILPKQMLVTQNKMGCSAHESTPKKCCESSCHSEKSNESSKKDNCGDDCNDCKSCSFHFVINFVSPETKMKISKTFFSKKLPNIYGAIYYSSAFPNIWQPPKLS